MTKAFTRISESVLHSKVTFIDDVHDAKVQKAISETKAALAYRQQHEGLGVGLAANQIGIPLAIFVISIPEHIAEKRGCEPYPTSVYINCQVEPVAEAGTFFNTEGCFSLFGLKSDKVRRYNKVKVSALSETGGRISFVAEGFIGSIFQHEADHLNGHEYIHHIPDFDWEQFHDWAKSKIDGQTTEDSAHVVLPDGIEVFDETAVDYHAIVDWLHY